MNQPFRQRLLAGELLVGTMVTLPAPEVAEILATVGFDWLFLDAEHAALNTREMQRIMQGAWQTPCIVRLADDSEVAVKKALDIGAAGIIVPQVNSAEQAAQVVRRAKYAPEGTRGVGVGRAHRYGLGFGDYVGRANEETAVIVQAEHIKAVENIEAIIHVPGVDAVLIGPYDLSASLGLMGQVTHPDVVAAIQRVTDACLAAGMRLGIFGMSATAVAPYIAQGYTLITVGIDATLLGLAAKELLVAIRPGQ
ncbi:MAG: 2,4-dihydroxyhept-2-ene-1,7-dioic acid aldolase [Ardenticatenaceae bacterium]|nr:2,4-dihydroxyhept-2-ene-1,7-dioic acid aldolase [Ardenticatenaceae bacterium]MCB9446171.1 2,4-dihydroxyhept-2-ene-1,7-dioic acid aldolase [Ardenticatenaceae bacterium]